MSKAFSFGVVNVMDLSAADFTVQFGKQAAGLLV